MRRSSHARGLSALLTGCLLLAAAPGARAQAWLPARGQGSVSLSYQYVDVKQHLFSSDMLDGQIASNSGVTVRGNEIDMGRITARTMLASAEYGILDRLAVSADLPYIQSRYRGFDGEAPVDNGAYHGGFQNLGFGLRYQAVRKAIALTPEIGLSLPTRDYPTLGHVAIGSRLKEFSAGLNLGRALSPFLPDAYVHANGTFVWSERVAGQNLNRETAAIEAGYFVTPGFQVRAFGDYAHTIGGMDWLNDITGPMEFEDHDRASHATARRLGGGLAYSLGQANSVFVNYAAVISGANTHKAGALTLGASRSFHGFRWMAAGAAVPTQP